MFKDIDIRHLRRSGVFIVNIEHISHLFLVFFFFVDFAQVNVTKTEQVGFSASLHLIPACLCKYE